MDKLYKQVLTGNIQKVWSQFDLEIEKFLKSKEKQPSQKVKSRKKK